MSDTNLVWWKNAVAYQIYWRSFAGGDSDGYGDCLGVISKLEYLHDLGVDLVWLTPMFPSPMVDSGYDVSDYTAVNAQFGSMDAFVTLLEQAKKRSIRIMLDMVFNHVSDQHPWYQAALDQKHPRNLEYRDFFIWHDGVEGAAPDDKKSWFGGSAWLWIPSMQKYVMHTFAKEQIDLNWGNIEVRKALAKVLTFWHQLGVDGFRLDAMDEPEKTPEKLLTPKWIKEIKTAANLGNETVVVAEMPSMKVPDARRLTSSTTGCFDMIFHFDCPRTLSGKGTVEEPIPGNIPTFTDVFTNWQVGLADDGWNAIYLGNHDFPRTVSRYGDDKTYREESSKLFAILQLTLRGTPFIYQGEELGLPNTVHQTIEEYDDVATRNKYTEAVEVDGEDPREVLETLQKESRDAARGPIPWLASEGPYNATSQIASPTSIFSFYKMLIALRRSEPALVHGIFERQPSAATLFTFTRTLDETAILVLLNLSQVTTEYEATTSFDGFGSTPILLASNYADRLEAEKVVSLRAYEAVVLKFTKMSA